MCLRLGGRPLSPWEGTSSEMPWGGTCLIPDTSSVVASFSTVGGMGWLDIIVPTWSIEKEDRSQESSPGSTP